MLMVCPHCTSTNIITIQGQGYCVNCGHLVPLTKSPAKTTVAVSKAITPEAKATQDRLSALAAAVVAPQPKSVPITKKPSSKPAAVVSGPKPSQPLAVKVARAQPKSKTQPQPAPPSPTQVRKLPIIINHSKPQPVSPAPQLSVVSRKTAVKPGSLRDLSTHKKAPVATKPALAASQADPTWPTRERVTATKPSTESAAKQPATLSISQPAKAAVHNQQHHRRTKHHRKSKPSRAMTHWSLTIFSGIIAASFAGLIFWVIDWSKATSLGNLLHKAALSQMDDKLLGAALTPIVLVILAGLGVIKLWLTASVIFIGSKRYDNRPINPSMAMRAGANATGSLMGLSLIGLIAAIAWFGLLVTAIKYIGRLPFDYWLVAGLGVATSFGLLLLGLWVMAGLILAAYISVLSGQKFTKSLAQGFHLAKKDYAYAASTGLGLLVVLAATVSSVILGFVVLNRLVDSTWVTMLGGGVVAAGLAIWYINLWIEHWLKGYRIAAIRVFGQDQAGLYLAGRHPKKISRLGITIALIWWLAVAIAASWALWHFRVDPTGLLKKLAASIY